MGWLDKIKLAAKESAKKAAKATKQASRAALESARTELNARYYVGKTVVTEIGGVPVRRRIVDTYAYGGKMYVVTSQGEVLQSTGPGRWKFVKKVPGWKRKPKRKRSKKTTKKTKKKKPPNGARKKKINRRTTKKKKRSR